MKTVKRYEELKGKIMKIVMFVYVQVFIVDGMHMVAFAGTNQYAENIANWVLDGAFWLILAVGVIAAGVSAVKRNITNAVITLIITAIICVICKNPSMIENLGIVFKGIIGLE